jgi:hypothetical protein
MPEVRDSIVAQYAEWTALSALRSGAPIKSRRDVYSALGCVNFQPLFNKDLGSISASEFAVWHERSVRNLLRCEPRLNVGWSAKIINVYLKTRCYIGRRGRHHLDYAIHPPLDAGLWLGLRRRFRGRDDILAQTNHVERIKDISTYASYVLIIDGCRAAAKEMQCKLIEVDQLWAGTEYNELAESRRSRSTPRRTS